MAKGNMLQGMARGKVGDVVFSRLNGQQISRVRNRQPYNPRTNKQLYQRAIMATVMQSYSAGKEIFNHSFQGKAVGSACQREFMKINAKELRSAIATWLEDTHEGMELLGAPKVVAPNAVAPVSNELIISDGTYTQTIFSVDREEGQFGLFKSAAANATVADFAAQLGLVAGDYYTIVIFGATKNVYNYGDGVDKAKTTYPAYINWCRLVVKESALTSTTEYSNVGQLFDIDEFKGFSIDLTQMNNTERNTMNINNLTPSTDWTLGAGTIRSRKDSDLRSHSKITIMDDTGIQPEKIVEVWKNRTTALGDSDLILEGGDI